MILIAINWKYNQFLSTPVWGFQVQCTGSFPVIREVFYFSLANLSEISQIANAYGYQILYNKIF